VIRADIVLRRVRPMGAELVDVAIVGGRIAALGARLAARGPELDGQGHALIPGLHDHHIHLLATAARAASVDLSGAVGEPDVVARLRGADGEGWLRAFGYDEAIAGLPDAAVLDRWCPDRPLRLQDRTGALWILNSLALARLGSGPWPDGVETCPVGRPTGRIWRLDGWLRERIGTDIPSLAELSRTLARSGVTGVTDAGPRNGPDEGLILASARASGDLRQRLMMMGREDLPPSPHYELGPLKLQYDERDPPPVDTIAGRIRVARAQGRGIAAHCVTVTELAIFLAALEAAGGARAGDRVEHGGLIPAAMIAPVAEQGLTVVSQPHFIAERGDRYLREVPSDEHGDLYRLGSLAATGIPLAGGSDAPYGGIDPWTSIAAAVSRRTRGGATIGHDEALPALSALSLWLGAPGDPGGASRRIQAGAAADLCLLDRPLAAALGSLADVQVAATIIDGAMV